MRSSAGFYVAEFSRQSDLGRNAGDFASSYLLLETGITAGGTSAKLRFEG